MAEVEARGQVLHRHRRPPGVGVQQQERLVVALDAARNHVLPLGTDLQVRDRSTKKTMTPKAEEDTEEAQTDVDKPPNV